MSYSENYVEIQTFTFLVSMAFKVLIVYKIFEVIRSYCLESVKWNNGMKLYGNHINALTFNATPSSFEKILT